MKKERKNTRTILIDIEYKGNVNQFEEFYGDSVTYQEIEQESYIEFKTMMFEQINSEIKLFDEILNNDIFKFTTDWKISNITLIKE